MSKDTKPATADETKTPTDETAAAAVDTLDTAHDAATDTLDVADGEHVSELADAEEVLARSADLAKTTTVHRKVFIVGPGLYAKGYDHEPNKAAVRQYAMNSGLWPTADVSFVSAKKHADGKSTVLTYEVEAIPAHDAPEDSPGPEVVADDTDEGGATKAQNATPGTGE